MQTKQIVCSSPPCERIATSRGLCSGHYNRRRKGKPTDTALRGHSGPGGINKSAAPFAQVRCQWRTPQGPTIEAWPMYGPLVAPIMVDCKECGSSFARHVGGASVFCSRRCGKRDDNRKQRERDPAGAKARRKRHSAKRRGAKRVDGFRAPDLLASWEERDLWGCALNGPDCTNVFEDWEHVIPLSRGGDHSVGNLIPSCGPCNRGAGGKHTHTPAEWLGTGHGVWF